MKTECTEVIWYSSKTATADRNTLKMGATMLQE
jgi:hypothetical protein